MLPKAKIAVASIMIGSFGVNSGPISVPGPLQRFEYSQISMGVKVTLTLYAEDERKAESAAVSAFKRFDALEAVFSDYRRDSEVVKLAQTACTEPVHISDDLARVLARALQFSEWSNGEFDVTVGPLTQLWRRMRSDKKISLPSEVREAKTRVGFRKVHFDQAKQTVKLDQQGMRLDFGGIAKGDACDQALIVLAANGIDRAMVEAGGDIAMSGPPPGKSGWKVTVLGGNQPPLILSYAAISTSGDAEQFVEIDGHRYAHIVDPRTGYGLPYSIQATVVARHGFTTDPMATTACILSPEKSTALAKRLGAKIWIRSKAQHTTPNG